MYMRRAVLLASFLAMSSVLARTSRLLDSWAHAPALLSGRTLWMIGDSVMQGMYMELWPLITKLHMAEQADGLAPPTRFAVQFLSHALPSLRSPAAVNDTCWS